MHAVKWLRCKPKAGSLGVALAVGVGLPLLGGPPVFAQSTSKNTQLQQLQNKIEERDAVINDLRQRVEQLERQSGKTPAQAAATGKKPPPPPTAAAPPAHPTPPMKPMQAPPPPPAQAGAKPAPGAKPAAPGSFEVSEETAERALERTLTQTGALLLPSGRAQVEPFFSYARRETNNIPFFRNVGNQLFLENSKVRRNEFTAGVATLLGLPFDSQFEFSVPYRIVHRSIDTTEQGLPKDKSTTGSTIGDLSIGVAKTLVREGAWWPDLVGRVTWDTNTGEKNDNHVDLGYGYNELIGSLTAVKRQDPLAFVGGFAYQKAFEDNNFKPGDQYTLSIGTILAASPETSLNLTLQQNFIRRSEFRGNTTPGSDFVQSIFYIGATSILGRSVSLSISGGIGLTDNSPDYVVNVISVIGFNAF